MPGRTMLEATRNGYRSTGYSHFTRVHSGELRGFSEDCRALKAQGRYFKDFLKGRAIHLRFFSLPAMSDDFDELGEISTERGLSPLIRIPNRLEWFQSDNSISPPIKKKYSRVDWRISKLAGYSLAILPPPQFCPLPPSVNHGNFSLSSRMPPYMTKSSFGGN